MHSVRFPLVLLVAGGMLAPSVAASQTLEPSHPTTMAADAGAHTGGAAAAELLRPTAGSAALMMAPRTASPFEEPARAPQEVEIDDGDDRGVPYMIAGGILFVAGAIAGDDVGTILMLGGAGAGAYGAFVYFGGD